MLRLPEDRGRAVDPRARIDQVDGIELVPAVVALVAARAREAADRARALDVAVGKRVAGRGGERAERLLLDDVALVVEGAEEIPGDAVVVRRRRSREEVVREPEVAQVLADEPVEALRGLTRRLAGGVRGDHDRRPVLVRPADHEHVVAPQPVVAGERVRRDAEARHVADVAQPARVRPRDRNQDLPSESSVGSSGVNDMESLSATPASVRSPAERGRRRGTSTTTTLATIANPVTFVAVAGRFRLRQSTAGAGREPAVTAPRSGNRNAVFARPRHGRGAFSGRGGSEAPAASVARTASHALPSIRLRRVRPPTGTSADPRPTAPPDGLAWTPCAGALGSPVARRRSPPVASQLRDRRQRAAARSTAGPVPAAERREIAVGVGSGAASGAGAGVASDGRRGRRRGIGRSGCGRRRGRRRRRGQPAAGAATADRRTSRRRRRGRRGGRTGRRARDRRTARPLRAASPSDDAVATPDEQRAEMRERHLVAVAVTIVTVSPCVGTCPANVTSPEAGRADGATRRRARCRYRGADRRRTGRRRARSRGARRRPRATPRPAAFEARASRDPPIADKVTASLALSDERTRDDGSGRPGEGRRAI